MAQTLEEEQKYQRSKMQKDMIIRKLRENGCRITRQRLIILDIILEEECTCCKEIYYKALQYDESIGSATVYRMVNVLEEIGAINRKNMYRIRSEETEISDKECTITYDDEQTCLLAGEKWMQVLMEGLKACGYLKNQHISRIEIS